MVAAQAFTALGWEAETIVCDNNSTDQTAAKARAAGAKVVFEPINQISRARNQGALAATGDWFLFIDADSFPRVELFADVAAAIQTGQCVGGGATVRIDARVGWLGWFVTMWNLLSRSLRWVAGSFIFCEARAFREIGGFSQELFAAEEVDFSRRLKSFARRENRKVVILHRYPLETSARKAYLYSPLEHLKILGRTLWHRGANLKQRHACTLWYDGRR
jgi:glycosyltransferase involved in cell wall biosynthesis